MRASKSITISCLVWALGACTYSSQEPTAGTRTDSAGVEIIEYSRSAIEAVPRYVISDSFDLSIGLAEGADPYLFGRIAAAAELSDGTVVVVDRSTMNVRYFSPDGTFLSSVGRLGEGPREIRSIDGWWLAAGDTMRAWDYDLTRLVTIADHGEHFETVRIEARERAGYYLGTYGDGTHLFWRSGVGRDAGGGRITYDALIRAQPTQAASWPEDTLHWQSQPFEGEGGPPELFETQATAGFHPDGAWLATGTEPEIRLLDASGALRRIVRWADEDPTVRSEDVEAQYDIMLATVPAEDLPRRRASIEQYPVPERFPSLLGIRSRYDGSVWVFLFPRPRGHLRDRTLVVSADGELLARIDGFSTGGTVEPLPRSLDTILRRATDELGAPVVRRHRLVRADTAG